MGAKWDEQLLEGLIRELARVFYERDSARVLAMQAGFPREDLPTFDVPHDFWYRVIIAVRDGKTIGGVQKMVDMAAVSYPGNALFARYRTASPSKSGWTEDHFLIPLSEIESALADAIQKHADQLTESDPICSLIAETNACGFYADEVSITSLGEFDVVSAQISFEAEVHFAGEQDEDKMWFGHGIGATLKGTARFNGAEWEIDDDECVILAAEIEDGSDD